MNFNFGTVAPGTPKPATGFTLPTATTASGTPTHQFGVGAATVAAATGDAKSTGFTLTPQQPTATGAAKPLFGTPTLAPSSGSNFTFGATPTSVPSSTTLQFGQAGAPPKLPTLGATSTTGPTFGGFGAVATPATSSVAPTLSLSSTGIPASNAPAFNLGSVAPTLASSNTAPASVAPTLSLSGALAASSAAAASAAPTLTFGQTPAAATTSASVATGFSLGGPGTFTFTGTVVPTQPGGCIMITAAVTSATVTTTTPAASSTAPTFGLATASTAPATSSTTTAVDGGAVIPASLTFVQLEDSINKWTIDLDEQAKLFINQAKQLNAWDTMLIANGEKILNLNNGIERVKEQQLQLDQELDFILAQQKELEDCIAPLEKELSNVPVADEERNQTYQMAENLDSQLKQMSEDLKEIIEHLNESNKTQESSDPVAQIGRILNAHMNSLQWIDRNTAQISSHLDQLTKMHDMHRRDNERTFQLAYE